jgi:hypothetical protein
MRHLKALAAKCKAVVEGTTKAERDYLVGMQSMATSEARRNLTPYRIAERQAEIKAEANTALRKLEAHALLQDAKAAVALRDSLMSPERRLREATFLEPLKLDHDGSLDYESNRTATLVNELRLVREETMRVRIAADLRDASEDELGAAIQDAPPALLHLVDREVARRQRDGRDVAVGVKVALTDAKNALPLPADVVEAVKHIDEIQAAAGLIADAVETVASGKETHRRRAVQQVAALESEGVENPGEVVAGEFLDRRFALGVEASKRVGRELALAVDADEAVASRPFTVPITDNPNPKPSAD